MVNQETKHESVVKDKLFHSDEVKSPKNEKGSQVLIWSGVALIGGGLLCFFWNETYTPGSQINSEKFGQYGDFIGGITGSLWSLAGILLFYAALKDQRSDFKTNRNLLNLQVEALNQQIVEFQHQKGELELSRKVYEKQSKTLFLQQFDSNFYSLLNVYLTIKDNLNNLDENKDFFKTLCHSNQIQFDPSITVDEHHQKIIVWYVNLFLEHRGHLSHYFKSFYRILKIIDSNPNLEDDEKIFYSKILRSQLTDYENLILEYNSHSNYGEKARPLILKYNILKHIPLFSKIEFEYFQNIQKENKLLIFAEWFKWFLVAHIPKFYEWEDRPKVEETFHAFDCVVGIVFTEEIEIQVRCKLDIKENHISLTDEEFTNFLLHFIFEQLVFGSYINVEHVTITPSTNTFAQHKLFCLKIQSEKRLLQNQDTRH